MSHKSLENMALGRLMGKMFGHSPGGPNDEHFFQLPRLRRFGKVSTIVGGDDRHFRDGALTMGISFRCYSPPLVSIFKKREKEDRVGFEVYFFG